MSNRIRRRHTWLVPILAVAWFVFVGKPAEAQTFLAGPTAQRFGQLAANGAASAPQTLGYTFSGSSSPSFSLAYGSDFNLGTPQCANSGGVNCTVPVSFQPRWPGLRKDAILVKDTSGNLIATTFLYGTGLGPQVALYPGVISTVAGSLSYPQGIAIDNSGDLYIADSVNQAVRKVSGGVMTTVAGTGTPVAVALDGAGNLYIADRDNNVIRKLAAVSHQMTIAAGGGLLNGPSDLAVDGAGNLYIADSYNGVIRKVDRASGNITVVAGGGNGGADGVGNGGLAINARLDNPSGVAVDPAGNVYIADAGNSMIRRVDASSGMITAVAGNGTYGNAGDGGAAVNAQLEKPVCVRLDAAGDLYIADQASNVIRRVSAQSGVSTTIAGNGVPAGATLNAPSGLALDSAGNLYIADYANNAVRELASLSGLSFPSTVIGEASQSQTLTVLNAGNQALNFTALTIGPNFTQQSLGVADCSPVTVLAAGGTCSLALAFTPPVSGNLSGALVLGDNSLNVSTTQSLALTGTGMAGAIPHVSLAATSILFAAQPVGTSSGIQTVTLSNTGAAALNISSIQLGGVNAADFRMTSNCQSVLAVQASCSISIVFWPSAGGSRSASLVIADNLANSPQTVTIAGTGIAASVVAAGQAHYYAGTDQHVHELYFTGGAWQDADLTVIAQGPNISGTAIATVNDTIENAFKLHYVGTDQHVHQIYAAGGGWQDVDLTSATSGTNAAAGSEIASFVDTTQNELNVDYTGIDQHVHQLYQAGGVWHDLDLTALTGGPAASTGSAIANFVDTTQNVLRINYIGMDQHVHEFYTAGRAWHDFDLTAATGGPKAAAGAALANFIDTTQNVVRINYTAVDQHVHEFYIEGGAWHDFDLTSATGGPSTSARCSIANLVDTIQNVVRINYTAIDQHVHEFYIAGGAWHDFDLTAATGGPNVASGSVIANSVDPPQDSVGIKYAGIDRHVHHVYISGSAWHDADLSAITGGPNISAHSAIANFLDSAQSAVRINYTGIDQHVHEFYYPGDGWHGLDLTGATGGPNITPDSTIANFVDSTQNVMRINYIGTDRHVHEFYNPGDAWHDFDLTAATSGPNAAAGTSIANFVDSTQKVVRINYAGIDRHVHEFYLSGNAWHDFDLTAATGGPNIAVGSPIANFVDSTQNVVKINYAGVDRHVHEFYIASNAWHDFDLTAATGAPSVAVGSPIANFVDSTQNVVKINYAGVDRHMHQFYIAGNAWHDFDLTAATGAPSVAAGSSIANVVDTAQHTVNINYTGVDQHVHDFHISGGTWHDEDLTVAGNGLSVAADSPIVSLFDTNQNTVEIEYTGTDRHVHELRFAGSWQDYDLSSTVAGAVSQ